MNLLVTGIVIFCQAYFVLTNDISNCANDIFDRCQLDEYFVSTLEIVDRELIRDRNKAESYFARQVCQNSHEELINFKRCVFGEVGKHCWTWSGVFDSIRTVKGDGQKDHFLKAKRYEQLYVILEYNLCGDTELRAEYINIRACSHKRLTSEAGIGFHDKYLQCIQDPKYPNPIKEAMDKMDLCRDNNRDYACLINAMLGDHCGKVKDALLRYASLHAGHAGVHADEINQLNFILQAAHSDHLRLPRPNECHTLSVRPGNHWMPTHIYNYLLILSFIFMAGLAFYFRDTLLMLGERYLLSK